MLVRLPQTLTVTEHYQLGRFGQVVLSSGGRLAQPTNIVAPGAPALALQAQNNLNRIILDDGSQAQNPDPILFGRGGQPLSATNTLRGGDTATGIVGVLNYTWAGNAASGNAYRIRPVNALDGSVNFVADNPRPTSVPDVGGAVRVASMNLLNFFNTFTGCTNGVGGSATDCRGASSAAEFARQYPKTVAAILATQPKRQLLQLAPKLLSLVVKGMDANRCSLWLISDMLTIMPGISSSRMPVRYSKKL